MTIVAPALDVDESVRFRRTVGRFPSGVTVVTGLDAGEPVGFTCQSFVSLSLEPLLVSISVMNTSTSFPRLRDSGRIAINVLSEDQADVSSRFARRGEDKWRDTDWRYGERGLPVLDGAVAWFECEIEAEHSAGDHTLVVARVESFGHGRDDLKPLIFHSGRYGMLS